MIAAVLCGGQGSRLQPVIGPHQKCAVDVGGRPWIARVLDFLASSKKVTEILLLSGYQSGEIFRAAEAWKAETRLSDRPIISVLTTRPVGTAAAIETAFQETRAGRLLVVNGDTLIEKFDLAEFLSREGAWTVRGRSVLAPGFLVDAGLYLRLFGNTTPKDFITDRPFLDIGTPEGLLEARRRFTHPSTPEVRT